MLWEVEHPTARRAVERNGTKKRENDILRPPKLEKRLSHVYFLPILKLEGKRGRKP